MSNREVLLLLANRFEREEPNRLLEIAVFKAVGSINEAHCAAWCKQNGRSDLTRDRYIAAWAPNYCISLNAAVTLEPKDAQEICVRRYPNGGVYVRITTADGHPVYCESLGRPLSEPRARCAAALRAKAYDLPS